MPCMGGHLPTRPRPPVAVVNDLVIPEGNTMTTINLHDDAPKCLIWQNYLVERVTHGNHTEPFGLKYVYGSARAGGNYRINWQAQG